MIIHYIQWFVPGSYFNDSLIQQVYKRDCLPLVKPHESAYGYQYFSIEEVISRETGHVLKSGRFNLSPRTLEGYKKSYEEVCNDRNSTQILKDNMKCNNWTHILITKNGQSLNFDDTDIVVPQIYCQPQFEVGDLVEFVEESYKAWPDLYKGYVGKVTDVNHKGYISVNRMTVDEGKIVWFDSSVWSKIK